jgi:hypothetical protein
MIGRTLAGFSFQSEPKRIGRRRSDQGLRFMTVVRGDVLWLTHQPGQARFAECDAGERASNIHSV